MVPALLLAVAVALGAPPVSPQTLVYYNARMALREGDEVEAVKLWLLRNALEDQTGEVSPHDADFRSVTWAALGEAGLCPDGFETDADGAGLWPVALHNWMVRNLGRRSWPRRPRPFDAFEVDRQQRFVSIHDVLDLRELGTVHFFRGRCTWPRFLLLEEEAAVTADLTDRQVVARLLRYLLARARRTLALDRVRGEAAIEARLFDIDLQLTALAAREARREAREQERVGREIGMSRPALAAMDAEAPVTTLSPASEAAQILRACVYWPVSEWMALSADRRLFLFHHARANGGDPAVLDALALGVIDALIARGEGAEVEKWIAARQDAPQAAVWSGTRGERLLGLDRDAGFRERAVIALHRGVHELEQGRLEAAMRTLAYALQQAPDSRAVETVQGLSRRWLSYVASQFALTDDLLVTLQELVPRRDYSVILEDLMWRAAFHADAASFERGVRHQAGRGALERRLGLLRPLARGDLGAFGAGVRTGLAQAPSETLRFLGQFVDRLEKEDAGVREAQLPTLARLRQLLAPLVAEAAASGQRGRLATELDRRCQAIAEGLEGLGPPASAQDRARSLAPSGEIYAGSVRLAPADPQPWPFAAAEPTAPSIWTPLQLRPVEWRDRGGELVMGWSIGG